MAVAVGQSPGELGAAPESPLRQLLEQHCTSCHGGESPKGGLDLGSALAQATPDATLWLRAERRVADGTMPPPRLSKLEPTERERLRAHFEAAGSKALPKRPVLRRLSREQWARSVQAMLGVAVDVSGLPPESTAYGSDTVGDVMSVSPLWLESLHDLASEIVARTLRDAPTKARLLAPLGGAEPKSIEDHTRWLVPFLRQAFRRPASESELAARAELAQREGVGAALLATLLAPALWWRVDEAAEVGEEQPRPLSAHALAARLSFFLASAAPDRALSALADDGAILLPEVLEAEARRLLAAPSADAFVRDFGGAWLRHREAATKAADFRRFPEIWDQGLRDSMVEETHHFLAAIVREDRSVLQLLDSETTFVNERLAKHYGLSGIEGGHFREVDWPDDRRGGLTGMASILFVTSFPLRTSPTLRGAWILDALLGDPPPPPPENVGTLPADDRELKSETLRQRLELHRKSEACAACHARIDPLGFALEHFDAMGKFRERDEDRPIDAQGTLPDGTPLDGASSLRQALLARSDDFVRNLSRRLFLAATGRLVRPEDEPLITSMLTSARSSHYHFSSLILPLITSPPFLHTAP